MAILIIGLGNYGETYEETRHNVGFKIVEQLAQLLGFSFKKDLFKNYLYATREGSPFILVKPLTYMNRSGMILDHLFKTFNCTVEDMIVITDNMDLPLGITRLKNKGSGGGHNGLKSINHFLGHGNYKRVYIGIERPHNAEGSPLILEDGFIKKGLDGVSDHVLSNFTEEQSKFMQRSYINLAKILLEIPNKTGEQLIHAINSSQS